MRNRSSIFRTKSIEQAISEVGNKKSYLKKTMGWIDLTALGVGAIIGTGIFILTGVAAAKYAGPAVVISFVFSGIAAVLAAIVYTELAAMIPIAGSAYTYTYTALGEIVAWLIGWNLILEYLVAAGAVAIGWGSYFKDLLLAINIKIPDIISESVIDGGYINIPPIMITLLITFLAIFSTKESVKITKIIIVIKLLVIALFIFLGITHINTDNWHPFMPFGYSGIFHGAAIVFFAYIGFDAVATAAEEVKNPAKDLPKGIIGSLFISTILYILVAGILTLMVPYTDLNTASPITTALLTVGIKWATTFISIGALAGLTTVLFTVIFAQSRIFFAMGRDGLLPPIFSFLHQKYHTPSVDILIVGISISLISAFLPVQFIAEMANIGTLSAFIVVSLGVIILRKTKPDAKRPFRVPLVPYLPILSIIFSLYLMINLPPITWLRFVIWLVIGLAVYYFYGKKHSKLNNK